jgi:hypothetical protein
MAYLFSGYLQLLKDVELEERPKPLEVKNLQGCKFEKKVAPDISSILYNIS